MTQILGIAGSLRAASSSRAVMQAVLDNLPAAVDQATADIGALPHYNADYDGDAAVAAFTAQIASADGLIFVTPEYNYSVPGVLKNAIDWASRPAYASVFVGKPCLIISVSAGALGGVRAQAHLKYIFNRLHPPVSGELVRLKMFSLKSSLGRSRLSVILGNQGSRPSMST